MYTLLSGWYKYLTQKEEYYVLVLGLDNAGKTTLLERIKSIYSGQPGLPPHKITPTIGLNIGRVDVSKRTRINFWDLGGQTDLQRIWASYYSECHGIIFMVDSTDPDRMEEVRAVFDRVVSNDEVEGVPVIVLANKQDLNQALAVEEIKEIFNRIAQRIGAQSSQVLPVSALKGNGVKHAVEWLFDRVLLNREIRPPIYQ